ncbi:MAG TPA: DUF4380 domain-containing protein [Candidatus Acidoferrum sp.]|nr:DUF4380 domain-containing protein [Candidatus Acidoferrum sp.]
MTKGSFCLLSVTLLVLAFLRATPVSAKNSKCTVRPANYKGWNAQEIRNERVTLTLVPKLGGRLMQVAFGPHEYLFVNRQYQGKYYPPIASGAPPTWYNYGGDKIWPLPEGRKDEKHWPGPLADPLDDGEYTFSVLSQGDVCKVRLDGPPDPRTGLQYSREISLQSDSPKISFHAVMKNASTHPIEWSVQSVTQYNTADASGQKASANIWAYTAANERSLFADGYHVRSGGAPPGISIKNGLVALNYSSDECELWFDTRGGWLVVADSSTQYAMVERFHFQDGKEYPGKASVIFYLNDGNKDDEKGLYYMEAEINSPMAALQPGETYAMDTEWFLTRAGGDFLGVNDAGVILDHLHLTDAGSLSGKYGVFFPGKLVARFFDENAKEISESKLKSVVPQDSAVLDKKMKIPPSARRVALHVIDAHGRDRGVLDEVSLVPGGSA